MQTRHLVRAIVSVGFLSLALAAQPLVVTHEPWLNWDFFNLTGGFVNDFDIIVDAPGFAPTETFGAPFLPMPTVQYGDFGGADHADTMLTWSGLPIAPGTPAHIGAYMAGSGPILDAYWTLNGGKVGQSLPITYELTRVVYDDPDNPWLTMQLSWPDSFFDVFLADHPDGQVGWTNITTFAEIPADALGLPDLNSELDLAGDPRLLGRLQNPVDINGDVILPTNTYWSDDVESFFDVFITQDFTPSPDFEALLYASIVVDYEGDGLPDQTIGQFWNLNRQSPEPSTALLLALGGLSCLLRRRRQLAS
jgi:hypothetical protein